MKNSLLTERFQELAGIKPLSEKTGFSPKGNVSTSMGFEIQRVDSIKELFQEVLQVLQDEGSSIQYDAVQVEKALKGIIAAMRDEDGDEEYNEPVDMSYQDIK